MRGISGKDHAAVDESRHTPALEFVERDPFEIEPVVAEHARNPRPHEFRLLLDRGVGAAIKLQVDAPDIVRLLVQQCRSSRVKRRVEPEPALGRKFGRHLDVSDQKLILEHLPCELRAHHLPQRRARAVAGHDIIRSDTIRPVRRIDQEDDMIVALLEPNHPVAPPQGDFGQLLDAIDQVGFGVELLEIDESRPLVPLLRQQVELIEQRFAVKNLADLPDHALVDHVLADTEPVPEFERAFREADRARAVADAVGVVEQHDRLPPLREIDGERQPYRSSADHDDGMPGDISANKILIGVTAVAEPRFSLAVGLRFGLCHLLLSSGQRNRSRQISRRFRKPERPIAPGHVKATSAFFNFAALCSVFMGGLLGVLLEFLAFTWPRSRRSRRYAAAPVSTPMQARIGGLALSTHSSQARFISLFNAMPLI